MQVELFGLAMETPGVTCYLWSPWRGSALEHKLFESLRAVPNASLESTPEEIRLHISDKKGWRIALEGISRVMKGWQEEAADVGKDERRAWRWLVEADVDANGYDMAGEKASFWCYLRLLVEHGGPGEADKAEAIDLNSFGIEVLGSNAEK